MIALLSPDAEQSKWVNIEIDFALERNRPVIPLLARGERRDAVPLALFGAQYVDLRTDYAGQVQGRLLPALRRHLGVVVAVEAPPPAHPKSDRTEIEQPQRTEVQPRPVQPKPPVEFDWVTVPAGDFLMGSDKRRDKQAIDRELPQHSIHLPEFRIARAPVTNAQYAAFVQAIGHRAPDHWQGGKIPQGKERHPVVNVSWQEARAFCAWVSEVTDGGVRLPTEAEWEKAARGADGRIWPWGDDLPTKELCNFNRNVGDTTPVDAYPRGASPYGVLDMAGNVGEWTGSLYKPYPYDAEDGREDPTAEGSRTLRGGGFSPVAVSDVRCAVRNYGSPDDRYGNVGFRVLSPGF